jgi:GAF domain-containing protein
MLARVRDLITPPIFEDQESTRVGRLLNVVLLSVLGGSIAITLFAAATSVFAPDPEVTFTLLSGAVMTVSFVALLFLARRGRLRLVSIVLLTFTWGVLTVWIYSVSGIASDSSTLAYALVVVLAGLLLGGQAAMIATGVSLLAAVGAYFAEASGVLSVAERSIAVSDLLFVMIPLVLTGALLRYAINSLTDAMDRARRNELAQIEANRELESLRASLEGRVEERTRELQRRSLQLQAATEVSQAATSILDAEDLMWRIAELIQERFGLYHVGLLLLDAAGEAAVYRAGSGQAGRDLRQLGFELPVGGRSIVGWCTQNIQARVVQDVEQDELHLYHELVPLTRSEAALPLVARGRILGALSVQSEQAGTFDTATVAVLRTIADHLAVALDNVRLFGESQDALEATRRAYGQLSRQAWSDLLRSRPNWGYTFAQQGITAASGDWDPEMLRALMLEKPVLERPGTDGQRDGGGVGDSVLALPLRVRDQVIGVLSFHRGAQERAWLAEEVQLLDRLVDQLGAALESAQLFQETQRRAAREQAIRRVTEQMRRSVDMEAILQNTVVELARALGVQRAYVRLGTETELSDGSEAESGSASDLDS